jgi:hypothetical protein
MNYSSLTKANKNNKTQKIENQIFWLFIYPRAKFDTQGMKTIEFGPKDPLHRKIKNNDGRK